MNEANRKELYQLLKLAYAGYGKGAPDPETFNAFVHFLRPFPLTSIKVALKEHCDRSEFVPTAVALARRCKEMDGRPTADEAWAIALKSVNESETVVWTSEIAQAMFACKSILDTGDNIGARMSFKDTYNRLVDDARAQLIPVKWEVSLGTDAQRREVAIHNAQRVGQIACDITLYPALPGEPSEEARLRIAKKTKELLENLKSGSLMRYSRSKEIERDRVETARRKAEIAKAVDEYLWNHETATEAGLPILEAERLKKMD